MRKVIRKDIHRKSYRKFILAIGILAVLILALYLTLNPKNCKDFDCFQSKMIKCLPAVYINEEPEASWKYEIGPNIGKTCKIKVTLLGAKEGDLKLRSAEGSSMTCSYPRGVLAFPEKDLNRCEGNLKEILQGIIIEKLYDYVIDNLGEIEEELRSAV